MAKDKEKAKDDEEKDKPAEVEDSAGADEAPVEPQAAAPSQNAVIPPDQSAQAPAPAAPVAAPVAAAPAVAPQQQASAPQASYQGSMGALPAPAAPIEQTPDQEAAQMLSHNLQFAGDLKNGAIAPKTYHDLYAEKGTLGKIGTLFGLMLSGAGAGLTHQPNALLAMMDKEIERDFDAQKSRKANELNWYNSALRHFQQDPENQMKIFRNAQAGVPLSSATGLNNSRAGGVQHLQDIVNKMPEGPQRQGAQNLLDSQITPFMMKQAATTNLNAVQQKNMMNAMAPSNPPPKIAETGKNYDVANMERYKALIQKGQFTGFDAKDPKTGEYIAMSPHSAAAAKAELANLENSRKKYALADKTFKELSSMKAAGEVPGVGMVGNTIGGIAGLLGTLGGPGMGAVAGGTGKVIGGGVQKGLQDVFERQRQSKLQAIKALINDPNADVDAMLPSWRDLSDPKQLKNIHDNMTSYFKNRPEEITPTLDQFGLKYEAPTYAFSPPKVKKEAETKPKEEGPKGPKEIPGLGKFYSAPPGIPNPFQ